MGHVLTFDLGTTYFKAALFDERLKLTALARVSTPSRAPRPGWSEIDPPRPGWSEIDPPRFIEAIGMLASDLRGRAPAAWAGVAAVSFATQANSFVLLDEADQPVTPIIVWTDRRAADFGEALRQRIVAADFYERTGIPQISAGFSPAKLMWLREHEGDAFNRAAKICYLSDYFTHLLTGRHATEAGVAGLTGLLDIHTLRWRDEAIAAIGAPSLAWPRVVRAGTALGALDGTATLPDLPGSAQFVVGCLDQYAGAIGTGNITPGGVSETTGTVLATVSLADRFEATLKQRGVFQGPAFRDGLYWAMLFSDVSGHLLEAFQREHAPQASFEQLTELAAAIPAGCEGLRLDVAASVAERRPIFQPASDPHTAGHRVRAILEAVAEELADQVAALTGARRPARILAAGGAARSALWLKIKSDRLGVPVLAASGDEPTSRGAAALALAAIRDTTLESVMPSD